MNSFAPKRLYPRSRAARVRGGLMLVAVAAALAACAERKPLVPDPDQATNYSGDGGAPAPAEAADGGTPQ